MTMEKKQAIKKTKFPNIKNIIIIASGKGGVGKSTVAAGLAYSLSMEGFAVGLLDADIYGPSMPTLFNLNNERPPAIEKEGKNRIVPFIRFGIKLISIGFFIDSRQALLWRGPMASNSLKQLVEDTDWGELDYLIIDTPPGTGDIHITLLQQYEISGAIVVTTPQKIALSDVQKAITMFRNEHVETPVLGIVENMAWFSPAIHPAEKYYLFGIGGGQKLSQIFNISLLAQVPMNENVSKNCDEGRIDEIFKDQNIKSAFDDVIKKIINQKSLV